MNVHFPTIPNALMTQKYGNYNPGLYGRERPYHMGEDYGPMPGNKVFAPCDGVVIQANSTGKTGYGGQVRIQLSDGAVVIIGHLSRWDVKSGDKVVAGQQIGLSGGEKSDPNSGHSTAAHIHFEYRPPGKTVNDHSAEHPTQAMLAYTSATLQKLTVTSYTGMSVRAEPSTSGRKLGDALPRGTVDYITETRDGWGKLDRLRDEWVYVGNPQWVLLGEKTERVGKSFTQETVLDVIDWTEYNTEIDKAIQILQSLKR